MLRQIPLENKDFEHITLLENLFHESFGDYLCISHDFAGSNVLKFEILNKVNDDYSLIDSFFVFYHHDKFHIMFFKNNCNRFNTLEQRLLDRYDPESVGSYLYKLKLLWEA